MKIIQGDLTTIPLAAELWMEMVKESRPDWEPNPHWWIDIAQKNMISGSYTQLFAVDGDDVCGFGDLFLFPEPSTGKLHCVGQHIYVRVPYRGSSAARSLVREWYKIAKDSGASYMELFAFDDEKERWNKKGFLPARVLMRKEMKHV